MFSVIPLEYISIFLRFEGKIIQRGNDHITMNNIYDSLQTTPYIREHISLIYISNPFMFQIVDRKVIGHFVIQDKPTKHNLYVKDHVKAFHLYCLLLLHEQHISCYKSSKIIFLLSRFLVFV